MQLGKRGEGVRKVMAVFFVFYDVWTLFKGGLKKVQCVLELIGNPEVSDIKNW